MELQVFFIKVEGEHSFVFDGFGILSDSDLASVEK